MDEIENRVAKSPLVSIDLDEYLHEGDSVVFDLKDVLFRGMILKEKDFRDFLKTNDWSFYKNKNVGLICSVDAIIPTWAYMLIVSKLKEYANTITFGDEKEIEKKIIDQAIERCLMYNDLDGKKVVVKGCGNLQNKEYAYTVFTDRVLEKVVSLMFGEPCSTVPIYKRRAQGIKQN